MDFQDLECEQVNDKKWKEEIIRACPAWFPSTVFISKIVFLLVL